MAMHVLLFVMEFQLKKVCERVCAFHVMASLSCDPGPHVLPIRTNQKAVIRAWHEDGGSVAVGEF